MKAILLIVIFLLGHNVVESATNDGLRDFMMDLSLFSRADVDLGLAMEVVGIRLLSLLPRVAVWSIKDMNVKIVFDAPTQLDDKTLVESINYPNALNMLVNVELPEMTLPGIANATDILFDTDAITNYLQGILLTGFFALVPLLLSWCCCCCMECGCCDGILKSLIPCCRCNVRWKNRMAYNAEYRAKCCLQCCCKIEWCLFSLCVLVVMFFWGYFTFMSHIGISQAQDQFRNDTNIFVDWVGEIMDVPAKFDVVLLNLELTCNTTIDELVMVLPVGPALIPHIQCIDNITAGLPDLTRIGDFVDTVNDSLTNLNLSEIASFDELTDNITYWLNKMQYSDLVILEEALDNITDSINAIPVNLGLLKEEIYKINVMKEAFPSQEEIADLNEEIDKIEYVQTEIFTDEFIDEFQVQMDNPAGSTTGEMATNIRRFQYGIGVIDSIDFDGIDSVLAGFANASTQGPDGDRIVELINNLESNMNGIDLNPVREGLVALNNSINGLAVALDGIDPELERLNATLISKLPDFTPLEEELAKINTTIETAKCINNITAYIIQVNNTVIIMPNSISEMIERLANMSETFQSEIDFDTSLGTITQLKDEVSGTLQESILNMTNQTGGEMLAGLPDINAIYADLEIAEADLANGSESFNFSDILNVMQDMNDSLSSLDDVSSYQTTIREVENSTAPAVEQNDTFTAMAETLESVPPGTQGHCQPEPAVCSSMGVLAFTIKESSDSVDVNELRDTINSFNDTLEDLPDAGEYVDSIDQLNDTVQNIPNMNNIYDTISSANDTIEGLAVTGFTESMDVFNTSVVDFDLSSIMGQMYRVEGIYDMLNQSSLLEQFNELYAQLDPLLTMLPTLIRDMRLEYLPILNDTFSLLDGWVGLAVEWKDLVLEEYVVNYDGYRLLAALLIIMVFMPCPALICFYCFCPMVGACCHFMCMKCLLCCACFCYLLPVLGIPFSVGMESLCTGFDGAVGNAVDEFGNVLGEINLNDTFGESAQDVEKLNFSSLILDGFSPSWAENAMEILLLDALSMGDEENDTEDSGNSTYSTNVTVSYAYFQTVYLKQLVLNYVSDNDSVACGSRDLIDACADFMNATGYALMDAAGDLLLSFEFAGFRIHPQFPVTLSGIIIPAWANLTAVVEQARPILGCDSIHALYMIIFRFSCERIRYGSIFFWGMLTISAMIFSCIACRGLNTYCHFLCCYTSPWDKRRRNKSKKKKWNQFKKLKKKLTQQKKSNLP